MPQLCIRKIILLRFFFHKDIVRKIKEKKSDAAFKNTICKSLNFFCNFTLKQKTRQSRIFFNSNFG